MGNRTTKFSCIRPTNTSDETDFTAFFNELFSFGTIYQPLRSGRIWHKVNF